VNFGTVAGSSQAFTTYSLNFKRLNLLVSTDSEKSVRNSRLSTPQQHLRRKSSSPAHTSFASGAHRACRGQPGQGRQWPFLHEHNFNAEAELTRLFAPQDGSDHVTLGRKKSRCKPLMWKLFTNRVLSFVARPKSGQQRTLQAPNLLCLNRSSLLQRFVCLGGIAHCSSLVESSYTPTHLHPRATGNNMCLNFPEQKCNSISTRCYKSTRPHLIFSYKILVF